MHCPPSILLPATLIALAFGVAPGCAGPARGPSVEAVTGPSAEVVRSTAAVSIGAPTAVPLEAPGATSPSERAAEIDLAAITTEVESRLRALQVCYEQRLADAPDLSGEVLIHWGINTEGVVEEACISKNTVEDRALVACVNHLVASAPYPASQAYPIDVTVPFVFGRG